MPPFIRRPWAKLAYAENKTVTAALPLVEHALDVAACGEALLRAGAWARALEAAAGRALTELDLVRIVALMALHDIGKANWGFQARWDPRAERIGHEGQVAPLWFDKALRETAAAAAFREAIMRFGAQKHLSALMAHHGRPREEFRKPEAGVPPWEKHSRYWKPRDGYDPSAAAAEVIAQVGERYSQAWEEGPKLPDSLRFVALFAGLVTLADWLGSDTTLFPVEGPYGAEREAMRGERARQAVASRGLTPLDMPATDFETAFGFPPRGVQNGADAADLGPVALIEAETGSGKTEAALWRWLALRRRGEVDGLFFALPTRTAAVQLHKRVQDMLDRVFGKDVIEAVLAVPGYLQAGDAQGQALPGYEVRWDDGGTDSRWAAERSNRYLAARVAVGTIDQALLGALRVKHAPVRAAALARSLLVVDEVHASDAYMGAVLRQLLTNHTHAGGRAVLLSATLGADARALLLGQTPPDLETAAAVPYPALAGTDAAPRQVSAEGTRTKAVRFETSVDIGNPEVIAKRAIDAARQGASVLVVRNSVRGAIAVAQAIEAREPGLAFKVGREGSEVATLHHGRFAPNDRQKLDRAVETAFGKRRTAAGRVLVGTQTLEQSLDLDADLLITDLAPIDVLLQRIGRLHRHDRKDRGDFAEARAIVLRPDDLTPLLKRAEHGLGPMADGRGVYPNLLQLAATLRVIERCPEVSIPADNRRLVEHALHSAVAEELAAELGTDWINHARACSNIAFADQKTGEDLSLDLATEFRDLVFPDMSETVATRLGAKDLLVDFDPSLPGPFGETVHRLRIPHWMARGVGPEEKPEVLETDADGAHFRLGDRSYTYGRWGLIAD